MKLAVSLLFPIALVACARETEPDPTPAQDNGVYTKIDPTESPAAGPPTAAATGGTWRQASVQNRPGLLFGGATDAEAVVAIYCDERRGLVIERRALVPTGEIDMMSLAAGNERQDLAVSPVQEGGGPVLRAAVPFNAELLKVLQRSPTPLTMDVGEAANLSLPPTPLLPQLVNTCRSNG